jgi:hypothetical protein
VRSPYNSLGRPGLTRETRLTGDRPALRPYRGSLYLWRRQRSGCATVSTSRDLIRKIDFFEPLDDKIVNKIAQVCIPREYSAGDYIVRQGDLGLGLYFITSGRVKVEIERNAVKTVVAHLEAGSFLGELSIIDNKPRSANVICLADTSCLLLTRDSFQKLMNKYPEIAIQMARALAARLRNTDERVGPHAFVVPVVIEESPVFTVEATSTSAFQNDSPAPTERSRIKDLLADSFGFLYVLKSLARFSLAIVGCPVSGDRAPREAGFGNTADHENPR